MWRGILACITAASWAKRGERGIYSKHETSAKRETREGEK